MNSKASANTINIKVQIFLAQRGKITSKAREKMFLMKDLRITFYICNWCFFNPLSS
jgi:hypothetical protein